LSCGINLLQMQGKTTYIMNPQWGQSFPRHTHDKGLVMQVAQVVLFTDYC